MTKHTVDVALELHEAESRLAGVESDIQKFREWLGLTIQTSDSTLPSGNKNTARLVFFI